MNDPNKRIDVNLSSLLSLKAELLRKQEEVNKAKTKQTINPFVPKKAFDVDKKDKSERIISTKDNQKVEEYEDSVMLEKSRRVLQAKSKFYDKMTAMGGNLNSDDNCLVMFNHKRQASETVKENPKNYSSSNDSTDSENENNVNTTPKNPSEEWVEYTDCLGRSRQCLRKDLDFFKKKDTKLAENIQPREFNQNAPLWMIDTKGSQPVDAAKSEMGDDVSDMCTSIMSKHDQQKMNWEKKEQENVYKEDVHYQDVLFDEARQHGVGYYAFSTDDEERAKQRQALDEIREKTLASQKIKQTQKEQKDKIIAERVRAAKNRQRARLGLPPLEDEPEPEISVPEAIQMTKEEEKLKKREEKLKRRKEKEDKLREEERNRHIRPWDKMKDGIGSNRHKKNTVSSSDDDGEDKEWQYKPQKEPMSQEQWNELQRSKRNPNFAPPAPPPPPPQQQQEIRSFRAVPPPISQQFDDNDNSRNLTEGMLFFSSKRPERPKEFVRKNYKSSNPDYNDPIRNELDADYDELIEEDERPMKRSKGAEIPPPPTFEYYGPTSTHRVKRPPKQHLEESIEAGLKFIRNQSDKGVLPTKSNWTANADY